MALETEITKLTEAVTKLSGQIDTQINLLKAVAAGGGKAAAAATTTAAAAKPAKDKKMTVEGFTDKFAAYLGTGDKVAKRAEVKKLLTYFEAEKVGAIPEAKWPEALSFLAKLEAGEEPDYGGDDGDDEPLV